MASNYNGFDGAVTGRAAVVVPVPDDSDPQNAAAYRPSIEELADQADYMQTKAGLLDVASTWTAQQAFNGNATTPRLILTGSNPSGSTAFTNTLTPWNIPKAAAYWSNSSPTSPITAFNILSSGLVDSDRGVLFNLAAPMATAAFIVNVTLVYRLILSNVYTFSVEAGTNFFTVRAYDPGAPTTPINLNSGDPFAFMVSVLGPQ